MYHAIGAGGLIHPKDKDCHGYDTEAIGGSDSDAGEGTYKGTE